MLKWLVQRVPDPNLDDVITDDPLATLDFEDLRSKKQQKKLKEIYSVNRTNPLYDDSEDGFLVGSRGGRRLDAKLSTSSPPATASSSSGYGSNSGTQPGDSHSGNHPSPRAQDIFVKSVSDDTQGQTHESGFDEGIDPVQSKPPPPPVWPSSAPPKVKKQAMVPKAEEEPSEVPFMVLAKNSKYVQSIGMFKEDKKGKSSSPLMDVAQNNKFVSKISFGGDQLHRQGSKVGNPARHFRFRQVMSPIGEVSMEANVSSNSDNANGPDSIVTDALLQMTSLSKSEEPKDASTILVAPVQSSLLHPPNPFVVEGDNGLAVRKNEDMDRVIKELTQAVMRSRNVATLTKAMSKAASAAKGSQSSRGSSSTSISRRHRLRNSVRALKGLATKGGPGAMRQLWERSGMKTNGRKLLDSHSEEDGVSSQGSTASRMRRNRRRARSSNIPTQKFPQRASSIGSVSSHGSTSSSTDPQYLTPFNAVTDSSYVYNEVYRRLETDDQRRSKSSTKGWTRRFSEDETESSSGEGSQKRVTFSRSVQVRKTDRDVRLSVADLQRQNNHWESFYGSSGKFVGDPSTYNGPVLTGSKPEAKASKASEYRSIFNSPYFDYRKTHSKPSGDFRLDLPSASIMHKTRFKRKERRRLCNYWQSILTLTIFGLILILIVTLSIFLTTSNDP